MMKATVYDLMVATPHVPPESCYSSQEFRTYREGYDWALVTTLRALDVTEERYKLRVRTRRLATRKRRARSSAP